MSSFPIFAIFLTVLIGTNPTNSADFSTFLITTIRIFNESGILPNISNEPLGSLPDYALFTSNETSGYNLQLLLHSIDESRVALSWKLLNKTSNFNESWNLWSFPLYIPPSPGYFVQHTLKWNPNSSLAQFSTNTSWSSGGSPNVVETWTPISESWKATFNRLAESHIVVASQIVHLSHNSLCVTRPSTNESLCSSSTSSMVLEESMSLARQIQVAPVTSVSPCIAQPCQNGGTCTNSTNNSTSPNSLSYSCQCDVSIIDLTPISNGTKLIETGWRGVNCTEDIDECLAVPCMNGGICENTNGSFHCFCLPLYTGDYCQEMVNQCATTKIGLGLTTLPLCKHGNCSNAVKSPFFNCTCDLGWTGPYCDKNIDDCVPNPCFNGGNCTDLVNGYLCTCPIGFNGSQCDVNVNANYTDICSLSPCLNGGLCLPDGNNSYSCNCSNTNFTGPNCSQTGEDVCQRLKPCENGATCIATGNETYQCSCYQGYSGSQCQVDTDECQSAAALTTCTASKVPCLQLSNTTLYQIQYRGQLPFTRPFNYSSAAGFLCDCPEGPRAGNCSQNCSISPCQNGGTCRENVSVSQGFMCSCAPGFTGPVCEVNENDCVSNPCQHGGVCMDQVSAYQCQCPIQGNISWSGINCTVLLNLQCSNTTLKTRCPQQQCRPQLGMQQEVFEACVCPEESGLTGPLCTISTAMNFTTNGRSALLVHSSATLFLHSLQLQFRTVLRSVLLFLVHFPVADLHLAVDFTSEGLRLVSSAEQTILPVEIASNSSAWYQVAVNFTYRHYPGNSSSFIWAQVIMHLAGNSSLAVSRTVLLGSVTGTLDTENVTASTWDLYLGSLATLQPTGNLSSAVAARWNSTEVAFRGCLRYVYLNRQPFPSDFRFISQASSVLITRDTSSTSLISLHVVNVTECARDSLTWSPCTGQCTGSGVAECVDLWDVARCVCNRPFTGTNCNSELEQLTFGYENRKSYAVVSIPTADVTEKLNISSWRNVSMFLTTRNQDQLLFYLGNENATQFFSAAFENSSLVLRRKLGAVMNTTYLYTSGWRLVDGVPRFLTFSYSISSNLWIVRTRRKDRVGNYTQVVLTSSSSLSTQPWLEFSVLLLGGFAALKAPLLSSVNVVRNRRDLTTSMPPPGSYSSSVSTFKGILQDIRMNDLRVPVLSNSTDISNNVDLLSSTDVIGVMAGALSDPLCTNGSAPCLNGGNCSTPQYNQIKCSCPPSWSGDLCEVPNFCQAGSIQCQPGFHCVNLADRATCVGSATFDGVASHVVFVARNFPESYSFHQLTLGIRTRATNGTVLEIISNQLALLLAVRLTGANQMTLITQDGQIHNVASSSIEDGAWHNLSIQTSPRVTVSVDGNVLLDSNGVGNMTHIANVWIGAGFYTRNFYKGCVRDVQLDSHYPLSFDTTSTLSSMPKLLAQFQMDSSQSSKWSPNCTGDPVCSSQSCLNSGQCVDRFNIFTCACPIGYVGNRCQFPDCSHLQCPAGVDCVVNCPTNLTSQCQSSSVGFRCNCTTDRVGVSCEYWSLCVTKGVMVKVSSTGVSSSSLPGSPCQNGGECQSLQNSTGDGFLQPEYLCHCPASWTGRNCEVALNTASLNIGLIVGLCVGIPVLIIIIVSVILACRHVILQRAQHGVYSPQMTEGTIPAGRPLEDVLKRPPEERLI